MKLKESKETQEVKQVDESNPIHEYLDFFNYVKAQLRVLKSNIKSNICICIVDKDETVLKYLFNWKPDYNYTLINKGSCKDFVNIAYDVCNRWIEKYNEVIEKLTPYESNILQEYTSIPAHTIAYIVQAYRDFQENPTEAEKKWFKCESH